MCRHSHTEIADRLFSLMKRFFETDSQTRAGRVTGFNELQEKLQEAFSECPEEFKFEYNWANWNLEKWLDGMSPVDSGLFEGKLARYSFDNVFRSA